MLDTIAIAFGVIVVMCVVTCGAHVLSITEPMPIAQQVLGVINITGGLASLVVLFRWRAVAWDRDRWRSIAESAMSGKTATQELSRDGRIEDAIELLYELKRELQDVAEEQQHHVTTKEKDDANAD